jgi:hypothetical protein
MTLDLDLNQTCQSCGDQFTPARAWQRFCSPACQERAKKRRLRAENAGTNPDPVHKPAECRDTAPSALPAAPRPAVADSQTPQSYGWDPSESDPPLTPSPLDGRLVLSGHDYELEYYDDGFPKIPACLDRRRKAT